MANSIVALDIGDQRIGVALADLSAPFPAPLTTLETSDQLLNEFVELLKKHHVQAVVVGLPRNQRGETTAQTTRVKQIVKLLNIPKTIPIHWQDESLTSVKAEEELQRRKKNYSKLEVDALAATYILEDFIATPAFKKLQTQPVKSGPAKQSKKIQKSKTAPSKRPKWFLLSLVLAAGLVLLVSSLLGWYVYALSPRTSQDAYAVISIKAGSSTAQIADQLIDKKLIRSAGAFRLYTKLQRITNLQAGDYRLSSKQSTAEIAKTIASGKVTTVNVLISPGLRLDQILAVLEKDGYSRSELNTALKKVRNHPLLAKVPANQPLEGYLFPDTYQIGPNTTAEDFFRTILDHFQDQITPELEAQIAAQGLSLNQAITLASIVQEEVPEPEVQRTVAQVFLRRLNEGKALGSDVTYMYAAALTGQTASPSLDSPYNTRRYPGLPPSAIANFNLAALKAVANPTSTDYLFFVAGDNGKTYFSRTLEEHEALIDKYCNKLCN